MKDDPITKHLDVIARLLEAAGYHLEVDYTGATIIVWAEVWPVLVKVKGQGAKGKEQSVKGRNKP